MGTYTAATEAKKRNNYGGNMKTLTKPDFDQWLTAYPRKLERDVYAACEPPVVTWNDFERAPYWPDSVVAHTADGSGEYHVIDDVNAPVITKIKPDIDMLYDDLGSPVAVGEKILVLWGGQSTDHGFVPEYREHIVVKHDVGTPYERWGMADNANNLRGFEFKRTS